jgi:hypothetical protein
MNVIATINYDGVPRLAFTWANQNVAATIALLDTLPAPYVDEVDKVYRQLKEIIGIATAQQVERSLQHQAEISVSSPGRSKGSKGCHGTPSGRNNILTSLDSDPQSTKSSKQMF